LAKTGWAKPTLFLLANGLACGPNTPDSLARERLPISGQALAQLRQRVGLGVPKPQHQPWPTAWRRASPLGLVNLGMDDNEISSARLRQAIVHFDLEGAGWIGRCTAQPGEKKATLAGRR